VAELVDDRGRVVLLLLSREASPFVEVKLRLVDATLSLAGFGDWGDEADGPARIDDPLSGLTVAIELPVASWVVVGRVEDGVVEEGVGTSVVVAT